MNASLSLSPQVFAIFSALVEERSGLHYAIEDRALFAERLTPRALERGFDSLLDYYYFLRYDPDSEGEFALLVESLVVHETYFFREVTALRVLVESFVPALLAEGVRPRIWCAACSTGEEPLTLAMLLEENGLSEKVSLVASDISERALRHARRGVYAKRSLRALPAGVMGRWLEPSGEGACVVPQLRDSISWRRVNLVDCQSVSALGRFDFIMCRNVLIYFRDETIRGVVSNLSTGLVPGGRLLVGTSESLLRFECSLVCEEQGGVFFYRNGEK